MVLLPDRKLEYLPTKDLKPDPKNPRRHTPQQLRALTRSVKALKVIAPILIDRRRKVIAGHARLEVAILLKIKRVPTICLDDLTEAQARAYMIADNRIAELACWDDNLLADHLRELSELVVDFDIEATGFEIPEIDVRIQSQEQDGEADSADSFEPPASPAISRLGDLWLLDEHRVYCGSALGKESYAAVLAENRAAIMFTDPPYNVPIRGNVSGLGKIKHREFPQASGEMSQSEYMEFLGCWLGSSLEFLRPGALVCEFADWRHTVEIQLASKSRGLELINLCVWVKTNAGMGSFYRSRHELVFVFRAPGSAHRNNVQLGRFGRNRTNVWTYRSPITASISRGRKLVELHPTIKPIALVADAILDSTCRNDAVLDPFLGSGTTVLAAERTGRRAFGIELDPLYVDTAVRRWQGLTGRRARRSDGRLFDELAVEGGAI